MQIIEQLKKIRLMQGIRQSQISLQMGKSQSWYPNIEQGIRKISAEDLCKVAAILNVKVNEIYQGVKNK